MDISKKTNLTMLCDYYELTMGNGYFVQGMQDCITYFDIFFRHLFRMCSCSISSIFSGISS